AAIVAGELGLGMVQHSLDLVDLDMDAPLDEQAQAVAAACAARGIAVHSTFTGLGAYGRNLLLDPDPVQRRRAAAWFPRGVAAYPDAAAHGAAGRLLRCA